MKNVAVALLCLIAALPSAGLLADDSPATVVILVRHAEKSSEGTDPPLTAEGKERAGRLVRVLSDLSVTAVYATQYERTRTTAEPLARAHGLKVTTIEAGADYASVMAKLLRGRKGETVVVVSHSNTIPAILKDLGVGNPPEIGEKDYDKLFLCMFTEGKPCQLLTLRYQ